MFVYSNPRGLIWLGLALGALAGCVTALQDIASTWFWLYSWHDRWSLLWRAVALHTSMGAILGGVALTLAGATLRIARTLAQRLWPSKAKWLERWAWPAPFAAVLLPLSVVLSQLLFSGGKTSKLSYRMLWIASTSIGLLLVSLTALVAARVLGRWAHTGPRRRGLLVAAGTLAVQALLTAVNQHVLPNLYDYLHHTLSVVTWLLAGFACWCWLLHPQTRWVTATPSKARIAITAAVAIALGTAFLLTSHHNENARAALLDSRAATSRTLMTALRPLFIDRSLSLAYAKAAQRASRQRRLQSKQGQRVVPNLAVAPAAHILLITVDALRPDRLGAYGYSRATSPFMDALAKKSWVFERAYTPAPHSSFAISSLMTSEYLYQVADLKRPMPDRTIASSLGDVGYYTAAFYTLGIFHTQGQRLQAYQDSAYGFRLHDHEVREADALSARAIEEIDRIVDVGEPPSFLWVHYFDAHEPYKATTFGTSDSARYDSEILEVDTALSKLITHARRALSRDVLVVISADHGEEFRDHGGVYHGSTLYDEQVRVPLIIHVPKTQPKRIHTPVELIDVAPTLLGLVGLMPPASMRGMDLRVLAQGPEQLARPVFSAVSYQHMVLRWPYKLIADLRYNTHELYDLSRDPKERRNLAGTSLPLLTDLRGEIHAWLDAVAQPPGQGPTDDPYALALARGRLGSRESIDTLVELLSARSHPASQRREAAQVLGGLADKRVAPALIKVLNDSDRLVAAEAAVALGRLYQDAAKPKLLRLLNTEDPQLRARAAVSLGRLREPAAVPALIAGLEADVSEADRIETIRWLGRFRDPRAVEPLLDLLEDLQLRSFVSIALGQIGDKRALEPLLDWLHKEQSASIRENIIRALGLMRRPEALPALLHKVATEPSLKYLTESLVRLNAHTKGAIGGVDMDQRSRANPEFARCQVGPFYHDWDYSHRTWCEMAEPTFRVPLPLPASLQKGAGSVTLALRVRRLDSPVPVKLVAQVGKHPLTASAIDSSWKELSWRIPKSELHPGLNMLELRIEPANVRLAVDHALFLPK